MASDSFTGADNTALSTHDANWGDAGTLPVSRFKLTSNQCVATAFNTAGARYTTSTADTSQFVLKASASVGGSRSLIVRAGASSQGYKATLGGSSTTYTQVNVQKNGSFLGTITGLSISCTTDHTVKLTASGTTTVTLSVYVDGSLVGTVTDSSSTITSGNPGFGYSGDNSPSGFLIDDWTDGASTALPWLYAAADRLCSGDL